MNKDKCAVCSRTFEDRLLFPIELLRQEVFELILKDYPQLEEDGEICNNDLDNYFGLWAELELAKSKQSKKIRSVIVDSFKTDSLISRNPILESDEKLTFGERLADRITEFGGSWTFIIWFAAFIIIWAFVNVSYFLKNPFDPYPYILLNLILSCLAAVQAPIILMSQNRQEDRDRARAEHEYQINLKSEIEIQFLNDKMDYFTKKMWEKLCEIEDKIDEKIELKQASKTPSSSNLSKIIEVD